MTPRGLCSGWCATGIHTNGVSGSNRPKLDLAADRAL
jgi:hypothetical protein